MTNEKSPLVEGQILEGIWEIEKLGLVLDKEEDVIDNKIMDILDDKRMILSTLAKKTGLSRQLVNTIVTGKSKPGIDAALKISYVLGEPVEKLFSLTDSAWLTPLKSDSDTSLYLSMVDNEVLPYHERTLRIKADKMEYFNPGTRKKFTKKEIERSMKSYVEERIESRHEQILKEHPGMGWNQAKSVAGKQLKQEFMEDYELLFRQIMIPVEKD
ncbi:MULTISPECIES: helix-turn-helix transcriptional regulator [unclassified Psychrobacillus]|uniref:helix-turn-helix transcriptional regulator n=1 Tax=unclassified Psychrobacillus TaxID=2636677 RepID=UPI0030F8A216